MKVKISRKQLNALINESLKDETQDDTTKIVTERSWDDFDRFDDIFGDYLPMTGEGSNMASQIATAVCKLVYKWFNDGDVYDNTVSGTESGNDLSSYANWLATYVPEADVLSEIFDIGFDDFDAQYEEILFHLCENLSDVIAKYADKPKVGSVYDCDGEFKCEDRDGDELEGYY